MGQRCLDVRLDFQRIAINGRTPWARLTLTLTLTWARRANQQHAGTRVLRMGCVLGQAHAHTAAAATAPLSPVAGPHAISPAGGNAGALPHCKPLGALCSCKQPEFLLRFVC